MDNKEMHVHEFADTVVPSTCKERGYTLHKCACGYEHKDSFKPFGEHSYALSEEKQPTCTENGQKVYRCSVCEDMKIEEIAAVGHDWSNWTVQTYAGCTADGMQARLCSRCGQVEQQPIPAVGHKLVATGNTDAETGMKEFFCENCGETVMLPEAEAVQAEAPAAEVPVIEDLIAQIPVAEDPVAEEIIAVPQVELSKKERKKAEKMRKKEGKKRMNKGVKALLIILVSLVALIGIAAALLFTVFNDARHYYLAKYNMDKGNYTRAYYHLRDCEDYKDAKQLLNNFAVVYQVEETFSYKAGSLTSRSRTEHDKHGYMVLITLYDSDDKIELQYKNSYEYNNKGYPSKLTKYYDGHKVGTYTIEYEYKDGKVISLKSTDENGNVWMTAEAEYSSSGYIKKVVIEYQDHKLEREYDKYGYMTQEIRYDSNGDVEYKTIYDYDENGNNTLYSHYNGDGKLQRKVVCKYDEYNNETSWESFNADGESEYKSTTKYKYDDDGKATRITHYDSDGKETAKYECKYDDDGNVTETKYYNADGELQYKWKYEYDKNGICTQMAQYDEDGNLKYKETYKKPVIIYKPMHESFLN